MMNFVVVADLIAVLNAGGALAMLIYTRRKCLRLLREVQEMHNRAADTLTTLTWNFPLRQESDDFQELRQPGE